MRVALVSCVKSKRDKAAPARDLYTSALFEGLRRYAERHAERWFILSALHGLVDPDAVIDPYEKTLNKMPKAEREAWAAKVQEQLARVLPPETEVIMLAGRRYREGLIPFLESGGFPVTIPLEGLPFGKQLQFLKAANAGA
jgi:cytoplasmic iron level regulating protein YaaA (DUF328/UPF0246 family)